MAQCTQLCTTTKKFYLQLIKIFLGITLFDTFSLLFHERKTNLMPLFLIACNRGLNNAKVENVIKFNYLRFMLDEYLLYM